MSDIFINGRFLTQAMTGVQRFATEITACLPQARVLVPRGLAEGGMGGDTGGGPGGGTGGGPDGGTGGGPGGETGRGPGKISGGVSGGGTGRRPGEKTIGEPVGRWRGQAWEQLELGGAAKAGLLLNLGNTAPLIRRGRQAVVIHDAGVFDTPESYSRPFRLWYRSLHWLLARNGTRLLTVSAFSRQRLAARLGVDAARFGVVPEGGEHILREPAAMDVLARHNLLPHRYALAVGTRAAHKNLTALQGAAALLARHGMALALAGARNATVFQAAGAEAARPLGRVSDAELRALYENALCLIFPSRYEGFGLPPLEAMWCGCPVLAGRAGATPEVCGDAALWFAPEDPEGIAVQLARLLEDASLHGRMAAAGRLRANNFSWPTAAAKLLELAETSPE